MDKLVLAGQEFDSRLIVGTGKYASGQALADSIKASGSQIATMAVKRVDMEHATDDIIKPLRELGVTLMPNTSGARTAKEAVYAAHLAREALGTDWIKVEVHPDQKYLLPDTIETYDACKQLVADGFKVFAYCQADLCLCKGLEELGVAAVMPLGSPIGSAKGLQTEPFLKLILKECRCPVIVDAGIGAPSEAARSLEMGAAAVMVNTAIAAAGDPVVMSRAFRAACEAGRLGYEAGLASQFETARATSPMEQFLNSLKD
ncbi:MULTISPECIES: thiazole synthase [unclassified Anaerobiospirillum]|uniref:thiazole synthase n=1 Tax=unclassified Anaerobiospirillum TaxID=2647410 RepID=UPI001FF141B4|nr:MULTISPECIES: thiazole synthase [unclassified Anaerobiospirillum]MCK0535877.1 thiazole synthase [Anaerobiospirillum sp. NML120511]MCK0541068.1 thiazole synthase [Anaerobiospirillum sp. NML02-A-032]